MSRFRRGVAHYKYAAAFTVFSVGLNVALLPLFGFDAKTACVIGGTLLGGLSVWYAAGMTQQSVLDRILKEELCGMDDSPPPRPEKRFPAKVCYSQLKTFGDFQNERVGIEVPIEFVHCDESGGDARNRLAASDALSAAESWVAKELDDRAARRSAQHQRQRELFDLEREVACRRDERDELDRAIAASKEKCKELGVKPPEDIPF